MEAAPVKEGFPRALHLPSRGLLTIYRQLNRGTSGCGATRKTGWHTLPHPYRSLLDAAPISRTDAARSSFNNNEWLRRGATTRCEGCFRRC